MQPSSPHEMFILLGENNKLLDALMLNPVLTKENQTFQRLKQVLLPCFSFRHVVSMFQLPHTRPLLLSTATPCDRAADNDATDADSNSTRYNDEV